MFLSCCTKSCHYLLVSLFACVTICLCRWAAMNSTPPTCSTSPGSGSSGEPGALWPLGWFHPHLHLHQECGREPGAPWCGLCGCHTGGQALGMSTISSTVQLELQPIPPSVQATVRP